MKDAILKEEKRRFKILAKKFKKNQNIDTSSGRCCGRYHNDKAGVIIHIFDLIFVANFPRWLFALWAILDSSRISMYARMRLLTFWLFWVVIFLLTIIVTLLLVLADENNSTSILILSLFVVGLILLLMVIDYHFTKVFLFFAKE